MDGDHLDDLARRLRDAGTRAVEQGYRLRDLAAAVTWTGAAGDAFRAHLARRAAACDTAGVDLVAAAVACERHADAVRAQRGLAEAV